MEYIDFTPQKIKRFKRLYEKALKDQQESFYFEGKEVLTTYAKYIVEYVEPVFNPGLNKESPK